MVSSYPDAKAVVDLLGRLVTFFLIAGTEVFVARSASSTARLVRECVSLV